MVGVSEPENVARELDDRVLEAASGPDEGNTALAGVSDGRQGAVHAAIRARRSDPDAVESAQPVVPVAGGVGRDPFGGQVDVLQGLAREPMGTIRGIEVADNGDAGRAGNHRATISPRGYHDPDAGCPLARKS